MSRSSPRKNPGIWYSHVCRWMERRGARISMPRPVSRFFFELDDRIAAAEARDGQHSDQAAISLLNYFYYAHKAGKIDPRVVQYMERARLRYCKDPKHIDKALCLTGPGRGNPGRVPSPKRRLSIGEFTAAGQDVENIKKRKTESRAVYEVSECFNVSERTVRAAASEVRKERKARARGKREIVGAQSSVIDSLSRLSGSEYARARAEAAQHLKLSANALDEEVKKARRRKSPD